MFRAKSRGCSFGDPVRRDRRENAIGGCGYEGVSYGHRAEIGYWLARPYWGQGIMTDVVHCLCDFAFDRWRLVRITAHVFDSNGASAKVLTKNGFVCEGILRKHHRKDGKFIDARLFALVH